MKSEITIGTKTFAINKLELLQGYVDQSEVAWEKHERGKNWVATVRFDPAAPNSLARAFWNRGSGSYVAAPASLAVGEVLEFGADYYSCGGNRHGRRQYHRVLAITPSHIVMRETGKPGKRPLRPVALDIQQRTAAIARIDRTIGNDERVLVTWCGSAEYFTVLCKLQFAFKLLKIILSKATV